MTIEEFDKLFVVGDVVKRKDSNLRLKIATIGKKYFLTDDTEDLYEGAYLKSWDWEKIPVSSFTPFSFIDKNMLLGAKVQDIRGNVYLIIGVYSDCVALGDQSLPSYKELAEEYFFVDTDNHFAKYNKD